MKNGEPPANEPLVPVPARSLKATAAALSKSVSLLSTLNSTVFAAFLIPMFCAESASVEGGQE
jgi:hypothetical protein